ITTVFGNDIGFNLERFTSLSGKGKTSKKNTEADESGKSTKLKAANSIKIMEALEKLTVAELYSEDKAKQG
ncbi:861_t:CDS:2, partial [Entrophospora sp. SA101]